MSKIHNTCTALALALTFAGLGCTGAPDSPREEVQSSGAELRSSCLKFDGFYDDGLLSDVQDSVAPAFANASGVTIPGALSIHIGYGGDWAEVPGVVHVGYPYAPPFTQGACEALGTMLSGFHNLTTATPAAPEGNYEPAKRIFNAMTRASEVTTSGEFTSTERRSAKGRVVCRRDVNAQVVGYECAISALRGSTTTSRCGP